MTLRSLRESRDLTLVVCAKRAGFDPAMLSRIERGITDLRKVGYENVINLARVLLVSPDFLIRMKPDRRDARRKTATAATAP